MPRPNRVKNNAASSVGHALNTAIRNRFRNVAATTSLEGCKNWKPDVAMIRKAAVLSPGFFGMAVWKREKLLISSVAMEKIRKCQFRFSWVVGITSL